MQHSNGEPASNARPVSNGAAATGRGPGLLTRLEAGPVICAEGYLFELERRGYVQAGPFVPEVVLDHPEQVRALHEQFVHAGSDVVEAFTYYGHREKLRLIGQEGVLEPLNRQALEIARQVADASGTLLAGNICNTNVYDPGRRDSAAVARAIFTEQVGWASDAGVDLVIAETFRYAGEAHIAARVLREAGLPAVLTLAVGRDGTTREGGSVVDACRSLADHGAAVVGLNCLRGPETMLPLIEDIAVAVDVPVAALPVPYRTHAAQPTFQSLREDPAEPGPEGLAFPTGLDPFTCTRYEIADFTRRAREAGVRWFGLCCGAAPHHIRAMAETLDRTPQASRYSPDMSKHAYFGTDPALLETNRSYSHQL